MIPPVRKERRLAVPPEIAFEAFTSGLAGWWPRDTHSVFAEASASIEMESGVDGRMVERAGDGEEAEWGRITTWAPPLRLTFTWYPGRDPRDGQLVDVRFQRVDEGTRMVLVHTGWETLGPAALGVRDGYDEGWEPVLDRYETHLNAPSDPHPNDAESP